jgi:N-acetylglutamate synthase-like GNAT family acetyltransferase
MATSATTTTASVNQACHSIGAARYTNIRHTDSTMASRTTTPTPAPFTEKSFYLGEFRGRTLAIAAPTADLADRGPVESVLKVLENNTTNVVLLSDEREALSALGGAPVLEAGAEGIEGRIWRALQASSRVGVHAPGGEGFARACHEIALRLGVVKLVWLDSRGGLGRDDGGRRSFVDLAELAGLNASGADGRGPLLREIEAALRRGLSAVNLCAPEGLEEELFTYAGVGTLFTRERYVDVRRLTIDDFSAAHDLVARGVEEGYLAPRTSEQLDGIFANGHGAFVEGRYLAGIAALVPHDGCSEIASVYTLTRFVGEGVGGHLVQALCDRAAERGDRFVFACTTTQRVVGFFERNGFARVAPDALPEAKWRDYDPARKRLVVCVRREL